jgi:hypothetical protein
MWFLEKDYVPLNIRIDVFPLLSKSFYKKLEKVLDSSGTSDTQTNKDPSSVNNIQVLANKNMNSTPFITKSVENSKKNSTKAKVSKVAETASKYKFNFAPLNPNVDYNNLTIDSVIPLIVKRYNDVFNMYQTEILVQTITSELKIQNIKELLRDDDLLLKISIYECWIFLSFVV